MSDFKVTHYRIKIDEAHRGPEQPFSAVLLSDLHNAVYGENNSTLLSEIRNENPELVFVAGDMLTAPAGEPQMEAAVALMDELTKKYPVYYVNGNHETRMKERPGDYGESYEHYSNMIKSFGVHLLENTCERVEVQKLSVYIWGLELPSSFYKRGVNRKLAATGVEELIGSKPEDGFHLLLAHNPCFFDGYAEWGADLTLSGHLHGGIIRLPFFGGVVSPQLRLFPRYDRGLYTQNGKKLIVSAGLGSHTVNLRINNPPELVVIDFV